ncbi:MAG: hypothetical protein JEY96_12240 [Bacteroidales bacterium]|nr:hypothetical protein [Bacteroidales bacterium]
MGRFIYKLILVMAIIFSSLNIAFSQNNDQGQLSGNFSVDAQVYKEDLDIGAEVPVEKMGLNSYANFLYTRGNFTAGIRYEGYMNAMLGFDSRYDGVGIPYRFITYRNDNLEITVGNFYEQFGSGLIFRSYEDKSLGIDNAIDGLRIKLNPYKGVYLKGFTGKQRSFFDFGPGIVRGMDGELFINEIFETLNNAKSQFILGGSFVSKYQKDEHVTLNLPENIGAFAGRFTFMRGGFNLSGEYAYKYADPHPDDPSGLYNYNTKFGDVILLNTTYSAKGLGVYLSVKRVDNMSFRSDINATLNDLQINYIPGITKTHTYSLASMYPYASQPNGEIGLQAEVIYNFSKGTALGGKYGTNVSVNFSRVNSLEVKPTANLDRFETEYFAIGDELYFQDFNIKVHKKINSKWKADVSYLNIIYNKDVIQGLAGYGTIYSNVGIVDVTYKLKPRHTLRMEVQALFTKQDHGDWSMGLLEYTIAPKWFINVSDQYNHGNSEKKNHYYNIAAGYKKGANRIQLGYGRQRAGIVCVGGICRNVPASSGFNISITSSF